MWETVLDGLLAILGGWGAIWYQLRNTRKNRMAEITAERKVAANKVWGPKFGDGSRKEYKLHKVARYFCSSERGVEEDL